MEYSSEGVYLGTTLPGAAGVVSGANSILPITILLAYKLELGARHLVFVWVYSGFTFGFSF